MADCHGAVLRSLTEMRCVTMFVSVAFVLVMMFPVSAHTAAPLTPSQAPIELDSLGAAKLIPPGTKFDQANTDESSVATSSGSAQGTWHLSLPDWSYLVGAFFGFLGSWLVFLVVLLVVARPAFSGNAGGAFRYLRREPMVWIVTITIAGLSGLLRCGFFDYVNEDIWRQSFLGSIEEIGPIGIPAVLSLLLGRRLNRFLVLARDASEGDSDALGQLLDSDSVMAKLVLEGIDRPRQRQAIELADGYNIGLLQRVAWETSQNELRRGDLNQRTRDDVSNLLELDPASLDDRGRFVQLRDAVLRLDRMTTIEETVELLAEEDLRGSGVDRRNRVSSPPDGVDLRRQDRRVGSIWRPPLEEAAA